MNNIINVLNHAARMQAWFSNSLLELSGYETVSTFYQDLSIAELFKGGLNDTFKRVCKSWIYNHKMFVEFIMALNWKIHEHYNEGRISLAQEYDNLWRKAEELFFEKYENDEDVIRYYYRITD